MAIVIPNSAEVVLLQRALGNAPSENAVLKLYVNDLTPVAASTAGVFTEMTGHAYAPKTLAAANWVVLQSAGSGGGYSTTAVASYAQQTWSFLADTAPTTIYGYFVVGATTGQLLWAERMPNPYIVENDGDVLKITPRFAADSVE